MSELLIDIQELYTQGYDASEISEMTGIQLYVVREAIETYGTEWDLEAQLDEADPGEMDGDAESAFASIGWGTTESYVADNDYFDDYS